MTPYARVEEAVRPDLDAGPAPNVPSTARDYGGGVEDTDRRLVEPLRLLERMSFTEMAKRIDSSTRAVQYRVRHLQEHVVVTDYSALVDWDALGLPSAAFVSITPQDP